jgi:hypothetical protein
MVLLIEVRRTTFIISLTHALQQTTPWFRY